MREFVSVPCDLYVLKADADLMENEGMEKQGYITVDPNEIDQYELINKHAFQPSIQLDSNTFLVTFIFK